jgi:hypothetical protein
MTRPKKSPDQISNAEVRKTLADDVRAFLKAGNKIEQVPTGFSNQDPLGGRRHIILGPRKKG